MGSYLDRRKRVGPREQSHGLGIVRSSDSRARVLEGGPPVRPLSLEAFRDDRLRRNARSAECLDSLGVLPTDRSFDDLFRKDEPDFAFGSLIRCSISHVPAGSDKASKSGEIINALSRRRDGTDWAGNCIDRFLSDLPSRLRLVVLMSNDDDYVEACFDRIARVRPGLKRLSEVAYSDDRVTFVHIAHCSGTSVSHQQKWLARAEGRQGDKARLADEAVRGAGYEPKVTNLRSATPSEPKIRRSTPSRVDKDVPLNPPQASVSTGQMMRNGTQVPKAKDGSLFLPETRRGGGYQIGAKGSEVYVQSYYEALDLLRKMDAPRWRRPNAKGDWGIVTGVEWVWLNSCEDEVA